MEIFSSTLRTFLRTLTIEKGTKSFRKPPRLSLEILNLRDEILNNEPTTNNQTKRWFKSFTADQPGIQNRREDTLAKLLLKELKDKTYTDPKPVQSARTLERNIRFKLIVNSFDVLQFKLSFTNNK